MVLNPSTYIGTELDLFAQAYNWKKYWSDHLSDYVGRDVLDVGAGIGATAHLFATESMNRWLALEPDPDLAERINADIEDGRLPGTCETRIGILNDLPAEELFDTIIYADVLEHIEDDHGELARAAEHLSPGGRLIVLAPAHQWLFTAFDHSVGHYRRYDRSSLSSAGPASTTLVEMSYLDSVGILASSANRFLLRSEKPSLRQIRTWDRLMVPVSRFVDPVLGRRIGKSIIGVWQRG